MLITDDLCRCFDALIRSTIATIIIIAAVRIRMNRPGLCKRKREKVELVIGIKCMKVLKSIQAALKITFYW